MNRVMQWTTILGFIMVFGSQYFSNLPFEVYPTSEFWLNSPWLIFIKLGVVMMLAGGAFSGPSTSSTKSGSWIKQIGTTSLIVYWVTSNWFTGAGSDRGRMG